MGLVRIRQFEKTEHVLPHPDVGLSVSRFTLAPANPNVFLRHNMCSIQLGLRKSGPLVEVPIYQKRCCMD